MRLLHKGESLCCFRDSALVTYGSMLPSDLTLSALRFILSAKSRQSCKQDCETVDFCNSLIIESCEDEPMKHQLAFACLFRCELRLLSCWSLSSRSLYD